MTLLLNIIRFNINVKEKIIISLVSVWFEWALCILFNDWVSLIIEWSLFNANLIKHHAILFNVVAFSSNRVHSFEGTTSAWWFILIIYFRINYFDVELVFFIIYVTSLSSNASFRTSLLSWWTYDFSSKFLRRFPSFSTSITITISWVRSFLVIMTLIQIIIIEGL